MLAFLHFQGQNTDILNLSNRRGNSKGRYRLDDFNITQMDAGCTDATCGLIKTQKLRWQSLWRNPVTFRCACACAACREQPPGPPKSSATLITCVYHFRMVTGKMIDKEKAAPTRDLLEVVAHVSDIGLLYFCQQRLIDSQYSQWDLWVGEWSRCRVRMRGWRRGR